MAFSGFVLPSSGELYTQEVSWFNFESTIASIRQFLKDRPLDPGDKYYLVMDNAPWHKKAKRLIKEDSDGLYSDIKSKVMFVYLPPYSPDLNPIEQVWRKARREVTHNRFFPSIGELKQKLVPYFEHFINQNNTLRQLCSFKCFEALFLLPYQH